MRRLLPLTVLGALACASADRSAPDPVGATATASPDTLATDRWTYIEIDSTKGMWGDFDEPDWLRYFGLAVGDVTGDGRPDIVSGRYAYESPGGDLTGRWERQDLGRNADGVLLVDLGLGNRLSVLAEALPDVVVFERHDGRWAPGRVVAQVPATGHHNGQGYRMADLTGDGRAEVVLASLGGVFALEVPAAGDAASGSRPPLREAWPVHLLAVDASDEGFATADIDGDGDLDIVAGFRAPGGDPEVPTYVSWFENEGSLARAWPRHHVGLTTHATDRVAAGDLDGDGRADVVVAEERYPGLEPDANVWVYLRRDTGFVRQLLVTQYSTNNLDLADLDRDGDLDIVTAEHKGPRLALQLWRNDGVAGFRESVIDTGKENHLGARVVDIDGDGDLDIVGIGWDRHRFVHLWRNDALAPVPPARE